MVLGDIVDFIYYFVGNILQSNPQILKVNMRQVVRRLVCNQRIRNADGSKSVIDLNARRLQL